MKIWTANENHPDHRSSFEFPSFPQFPGVHEPVQWLPPNLLGKSKGKVHTVAVKTPGRSQPGRIHPIVIYPFRQPRGYNDLEALYDLIARLAADKETYARPLTVMDRKTFFAMESNKAFVKFRRNVVSKYSDILDAWCVDTCQMWYTGFGAAYERGGPGDVYWLIPGDFDYGSASGQHILGHLHDLPEIVAELDQDVCVGEITALVNHSKRLIDTYGTYALMYNWFAKEAQQIREIIERPRSEFFAIRHEFLSEVLRERWYAYEQTVVILLKAAMTNRRISRFSVGDISDLPEGRESFAAAIQQVERTERVLKSMWRERNHGKKGWSDTYQALEFKSEKIRHAALSILEKILG
jgi:hypothetical protein